MESQDRINPRAILDEGKPLIIDSWTIASFTEEGKTDVFDFQFHASPPVHKHEVKRLLKRSFTHLPDASFIQ